MAKVTAHIGLGSNLGDRRALITEAVRRISGIPGVLFLKQSSILETKAGGTCPSAADFLNSVVAVETTLSALELLDALLSVEEALGRVRDERWGPRTIDLDLLLYGEEIDRSSRLKVPHPESQKDPSCNPDCWSWESRRDE